METENGRAQTVSDYVNILYSWMDRLEIYEQMEDLKEKFASNGDLYLEKEYQQIYPMVLHLFEQLVESSYISVHDI